MVGDAGTPATPEARKLLIVLTDGQPDCLETEKQAVEAAVRVGIEVLGIGILTGSSAEQGAGKGCTQQKQRCGKNFTEPADQKECLKAYDDARASGERYRKAMGEAMWKAYGDGSGAWMCFRCSEFSIAETKAGAQALAWDPFAQK